MSKRLQVLLEESEFREVQRVARRHRMTVADWVRQALRAARRREALGGADRKLEVVRLADIQQMLAEIERGYAEPPSR